jgi:hypothetical protein
VIDVAAGEKILRKGGPGITRSDLLIINLKSGEGVDQIASFVIEKGGLVRSAIWRNPAGIVLPTSESRMIEEHDQLEHIIADALSSLKVEGRYRVFANLERVAGQFPFARKHWPGPDRVVNWSTT